MSVYVLSSPAVSAKGVALSKSAQGAVSASLSQFLYTDLQSYPTPDSVTADALLDPVVSGSLPADVRDALRIIESFSIRSTSFP